MEKLQKRGSLRAQDVLREAIQTKERLIIAVQKNSDGKLADLSWELVRGVASTFGGSLPEKAPRTRESFIEVPRLSNVAIMRVSSGDIPALLADGVATFGIVGLDQLEEQRLPKVQVAVPLGEARSSLKVMARAGGGVRNQDDLKGKNIVTPFPNMTKDWLDQQNIIPNVVRKVKSTEGSVASGGYDAGVDLVLSGESMRANGLFPVTDIREFEAVLAEKI